MPDGHSGIVQELQDRYRGVDPCTALEDMLDKAKEDGDNERVLRIIRTLKGYGCRNTQKR